MKNDIQEIAKKLETGVRELMNSENYKRYLTVASRFHSYSVSNTILIFLQCPVATHVAGYKTWQQLGRHVMAGEHGIIILAPRTKKIVESKKEEEGMGETEQVERIITCFHPVSVFDLSQTEGEALPEICTKLEGSVSNYETITKALISIAPVEVSFEPITGNAYGYYSPAGRKIVIRDGMAQAQSIKTLIHEISHSMLHSEALGEEKNRETKEVEAESIAFIISDWLSLDTSSYSFGYISSWSSGKNLKELTGSMELIKKTSNEIIQKLSALLMDSEEQKIA